MTDHHYHIEGLTDLAKIRQDCMDQALGKGVHDRHPNNAVLHFHAQKVVVEGAVEPVTFNCKGGSHDIYEIGKADLVHLGAGIDLAGTLEMLDKSYADYLGKQNANDERLPQLTASAD